MMISRSLLRLSSLTACVLFLTVPAFCGRGDRGGGSDYGGATFAPNASCAGSTFTGGSATCVYYSGGFGNGPVDDTIFHFILTDTSSSFSVLSATIQFASNVVPTSFGLVLCPQINGDAPCTTELTPKADFSIPTDGSGNPLLSANNTLVVTFSNFSGLYAGSNLQGQGLTLYFDEPNATGAFASITNVATSAASAVPEPASIFLISFTLAGLLVLAAFYRRRGQRTPELA